MSLAKALFTHSQSLVLGWLFGHPDRQFHLSELSRLTQLSSGSLQRELNRLSESGIVQSFKLGNLRMFQANPQSPVFTELISLIKKTQGIEQSINSALSPIHTDLEMALIYGSIAKNTDTASSDIDLMIVGRNLRLSKIIDLLSPLEIQLGRKINSTCYTPDEFKKRRLDPHSFINKVLAQVTIPVYGGRVA